MIKNIFLHIGLHKTGSSSIQVSLAKSGKVLMEHGYLYPVFKINNEEIYNHSIPFYSLFTNNPHKYHVNISRGNTSPERIEHLHKSYIEQFKKQVENFEGENLIISGEDISGLNATQLQKLKVFLLENAGGQASFHVIVFVRNPVDAIQSRLQEGVKHGKVLSNIVNNPNQLTHKHFSRVFTQYFEVFAKPEITVIRFEDAINQTNGLVGCFLSAIGFPQHIQQQINYFYANKSISYEALILQSAINENIPEFVDGANNPSRKGFIRRLIFDIPGQKIVLSDALRQKIWELSEPDTQWLHDKLEIEKYALPKSSAIANQNIWKHKTLRYISRILLLQPFEISSIICNEIYFELLRHYKKMSNEELSRIVLFLNAHRKTLNDECVLPDISVWKKIKYNKINFLSGFFKIRNKKKECTSSVIRQDIEDIRKGMQDAKSYTYRIFDL